MRQRKDRSHAQWCKLVAEQSAGEQTIAAFCRDRGLVEHSFYHHKRRMRAESGTGGFQEVASPARSGIRVVVDADGCGIEVQRGFDAQCLRAVVQALQ